MDNPSDEAIAEALRLLEYDLNDFGLSEVRDHPTLWSTVHNVARTIDQRNKLVEALEKIANRDLLELSGYHTRKWCIPETGSEYESKDPIFKRSSFQNAMDFQAIATQALTQFRSGQ